MRLTGKPVTGGIAEGSAVVAEGPLSPLGELNHAEGRLEDGREVAGRVLVFPFARGSTVGSYIIYRAVKRGLGPRALVTAKPDPITVVGAVISEIPMVTGIDVRLFEDGDKVIVDGDGGTVTLPELEEIEAVSIIPVKGDRVLLLRRSESVEHNRGLWEVPSGRLEPGEGPREGALRELLEETGLAPSKDPRPCGTYYFRRRGTRYVGKAHYFVVDVSGEPRISWEHEEYAWLNPEEVRKLPTVPGLAEVLKGCLSR